MKIYLIMRKSEIETKKIKIYLNMIERQKQQKLNLRPLYVENCLEN